MFKQMRTSGLKFIGVLLFAVAFIVGGFFISTAKVNAADISQPFSYSLSSVASYPNSVGGVTTIVRIGCFPKSGDKYDINTGKLCSYVTTGARIGCRVGSGDKYDINTGKLCLYLTSNISIGCASNSKDLYDINTGKRCINNSISASNLAITTTSGSPGKVLATVDKKSEGDTLTQAIPTEGILNNNLGANAKGIGSIFTWPMSARGIFILIIIILAIGYGIYSLFKTNSSDDMPLYVEPKNKNKETVKPIISSPQTKNTNVTPNSQPSPAVSTSTEQPKPKTESTPINPAPINKIPEVTPLTHPQNTVPNPQMPLNMSNNTSSQGQPLK